MIPSKNRREIGKVIPINPYLISLGGKKQDDLPAVEQVAKEDHKKNP